jgi:hypothetical protein
MSAGEALYDFIHNGLVMGEEWRRRFPRPGQLLERSKATRKQVASLTSDEALRMRFEPWMVMDQRYENERRTRQLRLDFDRRLRQSSS